MSNFCEWKRIIAITIRFDVDETYIHIYIIENVEEITESTLSRLIDVEIKLCNFMEACHRKHRIRHTRYSILSTRMLTLSFLIQHDCILKNIKK